ncbi:hypothetical protein SLEP1_g56614 [Rubroshorea leprosula]|uniref:Uncharacterized protein n=1 Tax=Rubroshorea leprosula TaxID=152421 RepID=A0AAV5MK24_9ROSI|nr:hypothetical protein SLEP1_g56614 [Rubroshorea leprosula]
MGFITHFSSVSQGGCLFVLKLYIDSPPDPLLPSNHLKEKPGWQSDETMESQVVVCYPFLRNLDKFLIKQWKWNHCIGLDKPLK